MATTSKDGSRRATCLILVGGSYETCDAMALVKRVLLYWRASRVPAAAVIPAPVVSMVNVAVKKSVVDLFVLDVMSGGYPGVSVGPVQGALWMLGSGTRRTGGTG